jgi:hypothetical protein
MDSSVSFSDAAAAVAVVCDAPVEVREDGGVDPADPAVVGVNGVFCAVVLLAVGGEAAEDFYVGLEREEWELEGDARAEEAAVNVVGEVAAGVDCDVDRAEFGDAVVEAEGSGEGPAFVVDFGLFAAHGSVDSEFGLGVEGGGAEGDAEEGEGPPYSSVHLSSLAVSDGAGQVSRW